MAKAAKKATVERLRELLRVEDGRLLWRVDRRVGRGMGRVHAKAGDEAGCMALTGYRVVRLDGTLYLTHRVIWAMVHGEWPEHEVDHINRVRDDNRIENLREATRTQNSHNTGRSTRNTSGRKGVSWNSQVSKWQATAVLDGRSKYLGLFADLDEAGAAYVAATKERDGAFAGASA